MFGLGRAALVLALAVAGPVSASGRWTASDDRGSYVLFQQGSRSTSMSGSTEDLDRARRLRRGQEAMLYVKRDGVGYLVRDPATLRRAAAIFAPQQAMGARQAALGSRQAALGSRQAALGAEQARIGGLQAHASPARQDEFGRQQDALGRQQGELGRQQGVLGRQQDALGREQDRLGRQADVALRALIDDALRRGVAQRVD